MNLYISMIFTTLELGGGIPWSVIEEENKEASEIIISHNLMYTNSYATIGTRRSKKDCSLLS